MSVRLIVCLGLLLAGRALMAGTGTTGFAFLKIGIDARSAGMGEAVTADVTDAAGTYWNPAGLAAADRYSVIVTYNRWIEDVRHNFVGFEFSKGSHYFGIHYISTGVDGIEQRDIPSEDPTAVFASHDLALGLSYARKLGPRWTVGATARYVYERIQNSVDALAFDVGVQYHVPLAEEGGEAGRWRVGFVVSNVGTSGRLVREKVDLPATVRLGSAYDFVRDADARHRITAAVDLVKPLAENSRLHLGLEYGFQQRLFARAGYQFGYEARDVSAGLGVMVWDRLRIDYAVVPFSYTLGTTHRVTAVFRF